jgi:predicted N-formylglutamate amidohydrolase
MTELLAPGEPPAVEVREGRGPFVIVCEHASNRLPRSLGTLGLPAAELDRHIAWDPGGLAVADELARLLDADLVIQNYSRLAIDCNREPAVADAVAERSEDTAIPHNVGLDTAGKSRRVETFWRPFHDTLERILQRRMGAGRPTILITVHTFTPVYRGVARPWHVGVISTGDRSLADPLLAALRRDPGLVVGDNEPYSPKDNVDYTIRRHGFDRKIPHVMIEIRNDQVADGAGQRAWAGRLARDLQAIAAKEKAA